MTPPAPLLASIYGLYLLAVITPGPNTFIVTRLALSASRRHAARAVLGIALGNTVWLCFVLGGVAVLLQRLPGGMRAVRYVGGLYLLYMGVRGWLAARAASRASAAEPVVAPEKALVERALAGEEARPFRSGLFSSLSNPNTLPFYLSLFAPTVVQGIAPWVRVAAGAGVVTIAMAWYGTLAWGLSTGHVRRAYSRREPLIRRVLALVLVAYGIRLLVTG
ncbi:Threonine efflux protein [Cystobacter fuscus DSM 2262]|uniref:Threonine efflux protein n=1 Tax=Cystobacter fuscus (strain ATCC 25194 / DSM 2262 / NBRC 100088 / M29) TaxID=1242864 RepID=S9P8M3_CYSF2|nr:LysE family transporter [Cystobacter fuscus]EPX60795.1 Threonine efflux protein [Cystobacter fuscus DSM 2262]